jgi:hypothetical protein
VNHESSTFGRSEPAPSAGTLSTVSAAAPYCCSLAIATRLRTSPCSSIICRVLIDHHLPTYCQTPLQTIVCREPLPSLRLRLTSGKFCIAVPCEQSSICLHCNYKVL